MYSAFQAVGFQIYITPHLYTTAALVLAMFQIHVTRRLIESVVVTKCRPGARMSGLAWLVGLVYYVCATPTLLSPAQLDAFLTTVTTPGGAAATIGALPLSLPDAAAAAALVSRLRDEVGPCQGVGAAFFAIGNLHQNRYHRTLAELRSGGGGGKEDGASAYGRAPQPALIGRHTMTACV